MFGRMQISKICFCLFIIGMLLTEVRCVKEKAADYNPWSISLRWIPAYQDESWDQVRTGLLWSFSFLGATLPAGSFDGALTWENDRLFTCDFSRLGFSKEALLSLQVIFDRLKATEEYRIKGGIDIGRLLMLTIYSSNHYYRITGMHASHNTLSELHLSDSIVQIALTHSAVTSENRLIKMPAVTNSSSLAFYSASEGTGSIANSSFSAQIHETMEVMPNGQLRFAIYDLQGNLLPSANALISAAGKPGKCMWCHESKALTLFQEPDHIPGYLTAQEFMNRVALTNKELAEIRNALSTDLVFANQSDHTQSELLYISFMEPSAYRIANDWDLTMDEAAIVLADLPTHEYAEFPFLGILYHRETIDLLSPYKSEKVPESAREYSFYEPDFF